MQGVQSLNFRQESKRLHRDQRYECVGNYSSSGGSTINLYSSGVQVFKNSIVKSRQEEFEITFTSHQDGFAFILLMTEYGDDIERTSIAFPHDASQFEASGLLFSQVISPGRCGPTGYSQRGIVAAVTSGTLFVTISPTILPDTQFSLLYVQQGTTEFESVIKSGGEILLKIDPELFGSTEGALYDENDDSSHIPMMSSVSYSPISIEDRFLYVTKTMDGTVYSQESDRSRANGMNGIGCEPGRTTELISKVINDKSTTLTHLSTVSVYTGNQDNEFNESESNIPNTAETIATFSLGNIPDHGGWSLHHRNDGTYMFKMSQYRYEWVIYPNKSDGGMQVNTRVEYMGRGINIIPFTIKSLHHDNILSLIIFINKQ